MTIFDFKNHKLFIVGDIHGEFKTFFHNVLSGVYTDKTVKRRGKVDYNNSVIVVLGDVGLGFESLNYYNTLFPKYNETLAKTNTFVLFIRGNHDDPSYYSERKINYSNIIAVPDYSILITKDYNSLCIGGGISADRTWRLKRESVVNKYKPNKEHHKHFYWSNEPMVYDETQLENVETSGIIINSVLTHIPLVNVTTMKNIEWARVDPTLEKDLNEERNTIKRICEKVTKNNEIVFWANGHIHNHQISRNSEYNFLLVSLNCNHSINDIKQTVDMNSNEKISSMKLDSSFFSKLKRSSPFASFEMEDEETELAEQQEDQIDIEELFADATNHRLQNEVIQANEPIEEDDETPDDAETNLNVQRRLVNNTIYGGMNHDNLRAAVYEPFGDIAIDEPYPVYGRTITYANNTVATNNILEGII